MRAVIYIRVSSDDQKDGGSLTVRERDCRAYAEAQGWDVIGLYQDVFTAYKPGQIDKRTELKTVREIIRAKQADVLLVWKQDRLARDDEDFWLIAGEITRAGMKLDSVNETVDLNTRMGRLIASLHMFKAGTEIDDFILRSNAGKRKRVVDDNKLMATRPLYGYQWRSVSVPPDASDKDARRLRHTAYDVNPDTAPIVQRIFTEYTKGSSFRTIAKAFTDEGIPTPRDSKAQRTYKAWTSGSVRKIVIHPGYKGEAWAYVWRGKGGAFVEASDSHKLPDGTIPPLVSETIWQAAQERMSVNKAMAARNNKYPEAALLRGIATCGGCGGLMHVINRVHGRDGERKVCYRCGTHSHNAAVCQDRVVRAEVLDTDVWAKVQYVLGKPELLEQEAERLAGENPVADELASIEHTLRDTQSEYDNYMRAIGTTSNPDVLASLMLHIENLVKRKRGLEAMRENVAARSAQWESMKNRIQHLRQHAARALAEPESLTYEEKRQWLEALGVQVKVYGMRHEPKWITEMNITIDNPEDGYGSFVITSTARSMPASRRSTGRCVRSCRPGCAGRSSRCRPSIPPVFAPRRARPIMIAPIPTGPSQRASRDPRQRLRTHRASLK